MIYNFDPANRISDYSRLDKHETFLEIAKIISKRSHDAQTQHGCVIVKEGRIIGTGFNGFLSKAPDDVLPNIRPEKYAHIIHSEPNAIYNCAKEGVSVKGAIAYIAGMPCLECTKMLIQCEITEWHIGNVGHQSTDKIDELRDWYINYFGVKIIKYG